MKSTEVMFSLSSRTIRNVQLKISALDNYKKIKLEKSTSLIGRADRMQFFSKLCESTTSIQVRKKKATSNKPFWSVVIKTRFLIETKYYAILTMCVCGECKCLENFADDFKKKSSCRVCIFFFVSCEFKF